MPAAFPATEREECGEGRALRTQRLMSTAALAPANGPSRWASRTFEMRRTWLGMPLSCLPPPRVLGTLESSDGLCSRIVSVGILRFVIGFSGFRYTSVVVIDAFLLLHAVCLASEMRASLALMSSRGYSSILS